MIRRQDCVLRRGYRVAFTCASAARDVHNTNEAAGGNPKRTVDAEAKMSAQQTSLDAIIAGMSSL